METKENGTMCLDEGLAALYVDNELDPQDRKAVDAHLCDCPACRRLTERLEAENSQLRRVFAVPRTINGSMPERSFSMEALMDNIRDVEIEPVQTAEPVTVLPFKRRRWTWAAAAAVVLAAGLFLFGPFSPVGNGDPNGENREIVLCSASVEGKAVKPHIYKLESNEPDTQFIWLEKE